MDILDMIRDRYADLTKKQKMIADHMTRNAEEMCFVTLKELSREIGVSEMTILAFCTALGFDSYNAVKYAFRQVLAEQNRKAEEETPAGLIGGTAVSGDLLEHMAREEIESVNSFFKTFNAEDYYKAAKMIGRARRVVLLGGGVSLQLAHYMTSRLILSGVPCMTVDTGDRGIVQSALHFIDENTLVVPISFPDYFVMTAKAAQFAKGRGAALLGLTDSTRADLALLCDMCLFCAGSTTTLFPNTLTTPVLAVNFLTLAVSIEKNREGSGNDGLAAEFAKLFEG